MYQTLKVGDKVNFNIPEIFRSCLPMKTKEMIAEMYKDEFTVEKVDPDTGYVYLEEFVGNIPHNGDKIVPDVNGEYADKVLYKGEYYRLKYPCEGYEAKAFKEYYKDGKLIDREEIRHEKYQPQDGIIIEGTQELPEGFVLPEQTVEFIKPQASA